jgi:protein gp37
MRAVLGRQGGMTKTSIEWCTHSLNAIRAEIFPDGGNRRGHYCEKISPGCANCYASRLQKRFGMPEFHKQKSGETRVYLDEKKLLEPLRIRKPARIFWNDMSDLFGEWVPDEWIDKHFAVMALTPQHTHLVLTKRAKRMREWATADGASFRISRAIRDLYERNGWQSDGAPIVSQNYDPGSENPWRAWPMPWIHLGVSVESQKYADERIPELLATPAAVRWVSAEPLLEAVDFAAYVGQWNRRIDATQQAIPSLDLSLIPRVQKLNWIVVGGESGPGARPFDLAWARSIIAQCRAADVPVFMKQLGSRPFNGHTETTSPDDAADKDNRLWLSTTDRKGGKPSDWPSDLRVREYQR